MIIFQVQAGQNLLGPNVSNMLTGLHEKKYYYPGFKV